MGKTMPFLPPIFLGMVNIAPIKMVMTGGWLLLFYPHIKAKWWHFVWEWRGTLSEGNFGFLEYLRRIAPRQPGMHGGQALGHAAQLEANKREKALRKECVCVRVCVFQMFLHVFICVFIFFHHNPIRWRFLLGQSSRPGASVRSHEVRGNHMKRSRLAWGNYTPVFTHTHIYIWYDIIWYDCHKLCGGHGCTDEKKTSARVKIYRATFVSPMSSE